MRERGRVRGDEAVWNDKAIPEEMLTRLKRLIQREMFAPGLAGLFINPFYFARRGLFVEISSLAGHIGGRTLDVGCGARPYERLFVTSEYVGMDVVQSGHDHGAEKIDVFYDGKRFPLGRGEFDSVVTNEVFEHVFNPDEFLSEVNRVLKDGGALLLTTPFVWDEHEQPYDYARYSSFGIKFILEKNGFEVVEQRKTMADIRTVFQLFNAYLYRVTAGVRRGPLLELAVTVILMAPFNILGSLLSVVMPANKDLYLDNVVVARKVRDA